MDKKWQTSISSSEVTWLKIYEFTHQNKNQQNLQIAFWSYTQTQNNVYQFQLFAITKYTHSSWDALPDHINHMCNYKVHAMRSHANYSFPEGG